MKAEIMHVYALVSSFFFHVFSCFFASYSGLCSPRAFFRAKNLLPHFWLGKLKICVRDLDRMLFFPAPAFVLLPEMTRAKQFQRVCPRECSKNSDIKQKKIRAVSFRFIPPRRF
jgi:hypothetical protein